jgi:Peroxisomal biogenesis factor 11 (PEX11)
MSCDASSAVVSKNPNPVSLYRRKDKASICDLDAWCTLLLTLDGRDKVTKVFQYACRFLAYWYSASTTTQGSSAERFAALKASISTSRKAFRLGRSLIEWQKLRGLWRQLEMKLWPPSPTEHKTSIPQSVSSGSSVAIGTLVGTSLKTLGLMGFWAADNVSFLAQAGFLDNASAQSKQARMQTRHRLATTASEVANQSYFMGAVAGLVTNWYAYWDHCRTNAVEWLWHPRSSEAAISATPKGENDNDQPSDSSDLLVAARQKVYEKQRVLWLALVKSVCDVLVFSNNPGVDLWKKYRGGRAMHEGFHCLCGLVSASTVIYANYPNE